MLAPEARLRAQRPVEGVLAPELEDARDHRHRYEIDDGQQHGRPHLADRLEEPGPVLVGSRLRPEAPEGELDEHDGAGEGQQDLRVGGQACKPGCDACEEAAQHGKPKLYRAVPGSSTRALPWLVAAGPTKRRIECRNP